MRCGRNVGTGRQRRAMYEASAVLSVRDFPDRHAAAGGISLA
ncbi:hypothetical protein DVDV_1763 [Desulfovibrio sp. DV]|nr:hypothetical protein DVDV_1763 [Desulfovibrio sp. DV]